MWKGSFFLFIPPLSWWCPFNNKFYFFLHCSDFKVCLFFLLDAFCRLDRDRNFQWCSFPDTFFPLNVHMCFFFYSMKLDKEFNVCIHSVFYVIFFGFSTPRKKKHKFRWFAVCAQSVWSIEIPGFNIFNTICLHSP